MARPRGWFFKQTIPSRPWHSLPQVVKKATATSRNAASVTGSRRMLSATEPPPGGFLVSEIMMRRLLARALLRLLRPELRREIRAECSRLWSHPAPPGA
jgi:hypothetical protein